MILRTLSNIIHELRREYQEQKVAFERSATQFNLFTKTLNFATSANICRYSEGGISFDYEDNERVVVTLSTSSGANTLAKLEISGDFSTPPIVRRVPYSGGARWIVSNTPRDLRGSWAATNYTFVVQTLVNGTLSARMIWEN